jgi:hypothetical protein
MLTFLSQSIRRILGTPAPHTHLRVLPALGEFDNDLGNLLAAWRRAELHLVPESADRDSAVAPATQVGASAFVAGHGARIYSLDAFRTHGPGRPRAA